MNLEQKIGQLIIIGFEGHSVHPTSPVIADIKKRNLGGVILFDRFLAKKSADHNILSAGQTTELISNMQDAADGALLVAVDQEGGKVNRFKAERGFAETPPAAVLGNNADTSATAAAAEQTARLLAQLGINLNLAPVVDLDSYAENPIIGTYQRSFSPDPETVTAHALTWINAHRKHNIRCCLKHFPGHGSARADSHLGFVDITQTWRESELIPYRRLISAAAVDAVMTGHLYNSVLDSEYPATLSSKTVTGLLRGVLGFTGPVLSDDLQMRAITGRYGLAEAACMALSAGVDLLIFGNNLDYDPAIVSVVVQAVSRAVRCGTLSGETIDAAWQRVQLLKQSQPISQT